MAFNQVQRNQAQAHVNPGQAITHHPAAQAPQRNSPQGGVQNAPTGRFFGPSADKVLNQTVQSKKAKETPADYQVNVHAKGFGPNGQTKPGGAYRSFPASSKQTAEFNQMVKIDGKTVYMKKEDYNYCLQLGGKQLGARAMVTLTKNSAPTPTPAPVGPKAQGALNHQKAATEAKLNQLKNDGVLEETSFRGKKAYKINSTQPEGSKVSNRAFVEKQGEAEKLLQEMGCRRMEQKTTTGPENNPIVTSTTYFLTP